jgi:hypothetical protein
MRARLTGFAVGLALVFAPAASAQDPVPTPTASPSPTPTPSATPTPTPTATPSPTPTPEEKQDAKDRKRKDVRRIYRDFERDGRIDDCDHSEKALKIARRSISDSYAEDFPDFRDALTAAIERHKDGTCVEATPTPSATATPSPSTSPGSTTPPPSSTPAPIPPPSSSPESGTLPDFGAGGTGGSGGSGGGSGGTPGTIPAPGEDAIPEGTPSPTPAPAPLPPKLVVTRAATDTNLFVPGTMLAIALLGLAIAGGSALIAKRTGRLQGVDQAWREAAWRVSGTWSDFADWLRRR